MESMTEQLIMYSLPQCCRLPIEASAMDPIYPYHEWWGPSSIRCVRMHKGRPTYIQCLPDSSYVCLVCWASISLARQHAEYITTADPSQDSTLQRSTHSTRILHSILGNQSVRYTRTWPHPVSQTSVLGILISALLLSIILQASAGDYIVSCSLQLAYYICI